MRRALAFLTPFGGAAVPLPSSTAWFPIVGAGLGAALGAWWWAADKLWPASVAAALVVAADLAATGMLHLDGLADAADGLLPHMTRERRLDVMREPGVGAFGAGAVAVVVLGRWAALAALAPNPLLLAGLWCASRTAMAIVMRRVPYARADGLASAFASGDAGVLVAVGGLALAAALVVAGRGYGGAVALVGALAAGAAVVALAWRRVGGFTGDVLGAAGVIVETIGLVVAAGRW